MEKSTDAQAAYAEGANKLGLSQAKVGAIIRETWEKTVTAILPHLTTAAEWFADRLPGAIDKARAWFDKLQGTVAAWWQAVRPKVEEFAAAIAKNWPTIRDAFTALGRTVANIASIFGQSTGRMSSSTRNDSMSILQAVTLMSKGLLALASTVEKVTGWIARNWSWLRPVVTSDFSSIAESAMAMGQRIGEAARRGVESAIDWLRRLPGMARGAVGNVGSLLYGAGRDLLSGFIRGITSKVSDAVASVKNAIGSVVGGAKRALGIRSPSAVFADIADQTLEGFIRRTKGRQSDLAQVMSSAADRAVAGFNPSVDGLRAAAAPQAGGSTVPGGGDLRVVVRDASGGQSVLVRQFMQFVRDGLIDLEMEEA